MRKMRMAIRHTIMALALCGVIVTSSTTHAQGSKVMKPDPARVKEIAAMLHDEPGTFGRPVSDRETWDTLAKTQAMRDYLKSHERLLKQPVPPMTEKLYRAIVKSGSRADFYALNNKRGGLVMPLTVCECLENKGRFIPKLEEVLESFFAENTWIVPLRKEESIANWEKRSNNITLVKAMRAWDVALVDYMVGEKLKPELRRRLRENLERRIFDPFRKMMSGEQEPDWWLTTTNNWNAVCLAGTMGAALTVLDSKEDRALFVAAAEKHSKNFLAGFPPDGYCTEGLSYYNYGFSHYIVLSEAVWQVTDGRLDLFDVPNMRNIALFGARIEIANGVYPSIADCAPTTRPDKLIMDYVSRRLGLGLKEWETDDLKRRMSSAFYRSMMHVFPNSSTLQPASKIDAESIGKRSYFDHAGILICRPADGSKTRLAACLKGGHNAEHHNHNDVGTFIVAIDAEAPISDAGAEVYTNRTFGPNRYESDALNSFGHPVPLVAGKMQSTGRKAAAKVLRADFADAADTFALDLKACYEVPQLQKLERTFVYSREGEGALSVTDEVAFQVPQAFETALITLDDCKITGPDTAVFYGAESAALVTVEAEGAPVELRKQTLTADLRVPAKAERLGIAFKKLVKNGRITVRITPTTHPDTESGRNIRNGGFENGDKAWKHGKKSMGEVTNEQASSGEKSLKVVDTDPARGSNWLSARVAAEAGATYELRGKVFPVSGNANGLGVYVRFYDGKDRQLSRTREERLKSIITVGGTSKKWEPFSKRFRVTDDTSYLRIWIHSTNAAKVTAYLDDLDIVRVGK